MTLLKRRCTSGCLLVLGCLIIFGLFCFNYQNGDNDGIEISPNFQSYEIRTERDKLMKRKEEIKAFTEITRFANYIGAFCPTTEFVGILTGWTICHDYSKSSCSIVFITTLKENSSFVKEMKSKMNCNIIKLHPSMVTGQNKNWPLTKTVDMLVLDKNDRVISAGYNSLEILQSLIERQLLQTFSQIYFSFEHLPNAAISHSKYLSILLNLQKLQFNVFNKDPQLNTQAVQFIDNGAYVPNVYGLSLMQTIAISSLPFPEVSEKDSFNNYHRYMNHRQIHCKNNTRIGALGDGGWNVCSDEKYRPTKNCLVYSFGTANSWSFDELVMTTFGCEVHCFDPSTGMQHHVHAQKIYFHPLGLDNKEYTRNNWKMASLKHIMQILGHTQRTIDILKMDIENSEWTALPEMISSGALRNVRQLSVEYHDNGRNPSANFVKHLEMLRKLNNAGFKVYWSHPNSVKSNVFSKEGREYSACYEIYYLNTSEM